MDSAELPFPYEIDSATQVVYGAVGPWSPEAISAWIERLFADPLYVPGMRGVLNLRFTAGPLPNVAMIQDIARALFPLTHIPVRTRWALLVGSEAVFARARLLETFTAEGYIQFRAFESDAAALAWLGVESFRNPWLRRI